MAENELFDFLCRIDSVFRTRQIPYFVTGSVGSSLYSQPRMTNDIDLVLELTFEKADQISLDFPQDAYYLPAAESLKVEINRPTRGHVNLIDFKTGIKADLYFKGNDELHQYALAHRKEINIGPCFIYLAPPEYIILRKLEFFREGKSEKHLNDIRNILSNQSCLTNTPWLNEKSAKWDSLKFGIPYTT